MVPMPPRPSRPLPSVIDVCPGARRPIRRTIVEIRRLVDALVATFPDAALLVRDPGLAERIETTPHDHVVAQVIVSARAFLRALDDLAEPP
jgi:hypothetical protein